MEKLPNLKIKNVQKIRFASVQSKWIPFIMDWYIWDVIENRNAYLFQIRNRETLNHIQINIERYKDMSDKYEMWGWNIYTQLPERTMLTFDKLKDMNSVITMMALTLSKILKSSTGVPTNGLTSSNFNTNDEIEESYFNFNDVEGIDLDDERRQFEKVLHFGLTYTDVEELDWGC